MLLFKKVMDSRRQTVRSIISIAFIAMLLCPSAVQFAHIFEGHNHFSPIEQSPDIHKDVVACDICNFNTVSFGHAGFDYSNSQLVTRPTARIAASDSQKLPSHKIINTQLRAPPILS